MYILVFFIIFNHEITNRNYKYKIQENTTLCLWTTNR